MERNRVRKKGERKDKKGTRGEYGEDGRGTDGRIMEEEERKGRR